MLATSCSVHRALQLQACSLQSWPCAVPEWCSVRPSSMVCCTPHFVPKVGHLWREAFRPTLELIRCFHPTMLARTHRLRCRLSASQRLGLSCWVHKVSHRDLEESYKTF